MKIARCNCCGWIGSKDELTTFQTDVKDEDDQYIDYEQCPVCGSINGVELWIEYNMDDFTDDQLKKLWELFGDIEIGETDDFIREEFLGFPVWTDRFEVWQWFDQHYSKGVYSLAYNGGE